MGPQLLDALAPLEEAEAEAKIARRQVREYERAMAEAQQRLEAQRVEMVMGRFPASAFAALESAVNDELATLSRDRDAATAQLTTAEMRARNEALWASGGSGPEMLADALTRMIPTGTDPQDYVPTAEDTQRWARVIADVFESITLAPEGVLFTPRHGAPVAVARQRTGRPSKAA